MDELKRFFKSVCHITLSSLLTLIIYFLLSIFLQAAANDSTDDGQFSLILFIVMLVLELVFCGILYLIRFHNNDEMEIAFMKEYLDEGWKGWRSDFPRALRSELYSYIFVIAIEFVNCTAGMFGAANILGVLYYPLVGFTMVMHPIVGMLLNLAIFLVLYTVMTCGFRERCATVAGSRGNSTYGTKSYIQSRRSIHK